MTACGETGCGGTIAPDGYCDTCGAKPDASGASGQTDGARNVDASDSSGLPGSPAPSRPRLAEAGDSCSDSSCVGSIVEDGYCDTCGLAAASSSSTHESSIPSSRSILSIAAPEPPTVSSRLRQAGASTAPSRRTIASRRTAGRSGIGAGLVEIPPTPEGDPAAAVMSANEIQAVLGEVPEEERNCSKCGRPVGRSVGDRSGRVRGFCGSCRTEFDFVTNEPSLANGELVAGQYEILGPLAHGGMGWIYLGRDKAVSDRWVVLKGLLNEDDPDAALAAVAERQFLAQIEHANIVNIYNFVAHHGAGYIVMEMVGGESLNRRLKRRRTSGRGHEPLPPAEAIAYVLGVLPALGYLHGLGLVYNDLKPANIMAVGDDVKLIDVGAVMRIEDRQAAIFGTQGFQAPEVAKDGPSVASDLFTVGRTLAVLIIRFVFHDGPFLHTLPGPDREPLFARWESLYRFLLRACAFHPDDRFQTADDMADQLVGVLREIVALSEGRPRSAASELFGADQLTNLLVSSAESYDVARPDWRVLPRPKVDPDDSAAAFLADLPELPPRQMLDLIDAGAAAGDVEDSRELTLRRAREQLEGGSDPTETLRSIEREDPWDWRVPWYRAVDALRRGEPIDAAAEFSRVWTELPGELAPKLAVALAAEMAGEFERATHLYELVISVDASYVSAAFGLARCRRAVGDGRGAVDAFARVPVSSAAHYDAQVAVARALVNGRDGKPSAGDLREAGETIERLQLDAAERAALSVDVYERALAVVREGSGAGNGQAVLGVDLDEISLRRALEQTYRTQARLTESVTDRIRLVDRANAVRPRSFL